ASSFSFFTLTPPCRVFDSRQSTALQTGVARTIPVAGSCGVPADAKAVAVNLTVTGATASGAIEIYPGDVAPTGMPQIGFAAGPGGRTTRAPTTAITRRARPATRLPTA